MSRKTFLLRSVAGVDHYMIEDEDGTRFYSEQHTDPIIEMNKKMATANDGYTPSREMRRVATIPVVQRYKWLIEEGWDCYDPEHADRLVKKLNDPEWAHLRTAPGRIGYSNGVMR